MRTATLADVAIIHGGGRLKLTGLDFLEEGFPAYGAGGQNGLVSVAEYNRRGIILSSIGARCGKCFYVEGRWTTLANTQVILPDESEVDARFLWYQLNDEGRWPRSGSGQPFIKPSDVKAHRVSLPAIGEQRRIAAILDQADAIRTHRRQILTHLDALSDARFRERFLSSALTESSLADISGFFGGASLPQGSDFTGQDGGTLLMKVSDMNSPGNDTRVTRTALWSEKPTPRASTVQAGAVILPKRGGAIGTNKKRIATRRTALDPNLMGVAPKGAVVTSGYLYSWFRTLDLTTISSGSSVPQLNKKDLAPLRVPLPPIDEQRAFDTEMAAIRMLTDQTGAALRRDDELFASLQVRAFKGEL